MGRLIDADELMTRIRLNYNNHQITNAGAIKDIIDTTRTAYDAEKVEEQIEGMFGCDPMYYGSEARWAVDRAIEIVRKGGIDG